MTPELIAALSTAVVAVLGAITAMILALRPLKRAVQDNTSITQQAADLSANTHDMIKEAHGNPTTLQVTGTADIQILGKDIHHENE